jgi:hypothetical protein
VLTGNDGLGQGYDIVWASGVRLVTTTCGKSARVRAHIYYPYEIRGSYGCAND